MSNNKPEATVPDADLHRIASDALDKCPKEIPEGEIAGRWKHGYITGAKDELIRHLFSQPSPAVLWVKASERLPKDNAQWTLRVNGALTKGYRLVSCNFWRTDLGLLDDKDVEWLQETASAQPIEGEQKPTDPWFILKYVKTVLERGFPLEDIISLIGKKLKEHSAASPEPAAQPIADSKEVPEEIQKWIEQQNDILYKSTPYHDWGSGMRLMGAAMYHKMQEAGDLGPNTEVRRPTETEKFLESELAAKETQIAGFEASNKEWGDKYLAIEKQLVAAKITANDYLNVLNKISGILPSHYIIVAEISEVLKKHM